MATDVDRRRWRRKDKNRGALALTPHLMLPQGSPHEEKFLVKIQPEPTGCWRWLGSRTYGYGLFRPDNIPWRAHRWSYVKWVGPIPEGLTLDHLCRNRGCVNPWHLEPVTRKENDSRYRQGIPARYPADPPQAAPLLELAASLRLKASARKTKMIMKRSS